MGANNFEIFNASLELTGGSTAAETARAWVARASHTWEPTLISAEAGLNALAVCRAIHDASSLTAYPLLAIDCKAQTPETFEREIVEPAAPRTMALTNLQDLPLSLQHRLSQLLLDDADCGGQAPARLVGIVSGHLQEAVAAGKLTRELCGRFPVQIEVPPLRRRPEDIPRLIGCVAAEAAATGGVGAPTFSREALALLSALPWRRNLEELREVLEVLVLVAEGGTLRLDDVLGHVPIERLRTRQPGTQNLRDARNHFEREYIASVLNRHRGRMDEAARTLGVQRTNLYRKVRQLGIGRARPK